MKRGKISTPRTEKEKESTYTAREVGRSLKAKITKIPIPPRPLGDETDQFVAGQPKKLNLTIFLTLERAETEIFKTKNNF